MRFCGDTTYWQVRLCAAVTSYGYIRRLRGDDRQWGARFDRRGGVGYRRGGLLVRAGWVLLLGPHYKDTKTPILEKSKKITDKPTFKETYVL